MRGGRGESRQTNHKLSFVYETYLAWTQNKSFLVMFFYRRKAAGNSLETPGNSLENVVLETQKVCPHSKKAARRLCWNFPGNSWKLEIKKK